jgi:hypothetical protein
MERSTWVTDTVIHEKTHATLKTLEQMEQMEQRYKERRRRENLTYYISIPYLLSLLPLLLVPPSVPPVPVNLRMIHYKRGSVVHVLPAP